MSRTHYQIYKEQTFVLARTLIVKHEEIASSINEDLYYRGYDVDTNPYNWRYYLNLYGEYHQADKDELFEKYGTDYILVKVPSTMGYMEVPLTKNLLHGVDADKTMLNEYYIGSRFYNDVVSRYPEFESLIIGILNPIDIDIAVEAINGEILHIAGRYKRTDGIDNWYDDSYHSGNLVLIEPQEDNIIIKLQEYINIFLRQWHNTEYAIGNDLYHLTMLGILYSNIPNIILNIRLGNCKTPRAHTFHIKQYLESFGQIGRYVDFIPIQTSLWLYRNVHYLEANAGKMNTFDMLLDNVLTPNDVPIAAYTARHELTDMNSDDLLPNGMFYKEMLNDIGTMSISDNDRTVRDILESQRDLARDNDKDLDFKEDHIQTAINWMGDDRINSKVLESEMADLGEPYPFTFEQMLFNAWGYSAVKGYYNGTVFATNPVTGDRLSFSAKDAYIAVHYCLNKAVANVELTKVPKVKLYHIPRTTNQSDCPTDTNYTVKPNIDTMMDWCVNDVTRRRKVVELVGSLTPKLQSSDSYNFFNNVSEFYHDRIRQYNVYCDIENMEERGDLELLAKRLYWMGFEEELSPLTYSQWFTTVGFDPSEYTNDDLMDLGLELVASATGIKENLEPNTKWLQRSLIAIMRHFISYTVHIIEKHSDTVLAYLEGQTLRFTNLRWSYIGQQEYRYQLHLNYDARFKSRHSHRIDVSNLFESTKVSVNTKTNVNMDLSNFDYDQMSYNVDVGTYALGVTVFNVDITESIPEPQLFKMYEDVYEIKPQSIYADIYDYPTETRHAKDTVYVNLGEWIVDVNDHVDGMGILVDSLSLSIKGMVGNIDTVTEIKTVSDSSSILPDAVFGYIEDASVEEIQYIDVSKTDNSLFNATIDDSPLRLDDAVDTHVMSTGNIEGSVINPAILYTVTNTNTISNQGMTLLMADPQIPTVDGGKDVSVLDVVNVVGSNDYVAFELFGSSDLTLSTLDVTATLIDSDVESIYDSSVDSNKVINVSGGVYDESINLEVYDSSKLFLVEPNANIHDDKVNGYNVTESMSINFGNFIVDSRIVVDVYDKHCINTVNIFASAKDDMFKFKTTENNKVRFNVEILKAALDTLPDGLHLLDHDRYAIRTVNLDLAVVESEIKYNHTDVIKLRPTPLSLVVIEANIALGLDTTTMYVETDISYFKGTVDDVNLNLNGYDKTSTKVINVYGLTSDATVNYTWTDLDKTKPNTYSAKLSDDIQNVRLVNNTAYQPNLINAIIKDAPEIDTLSELVKTHPYSMSARLKDPTINIDSILDIQQVNIYTQRLTLDLNDSDIMKDSVDVQCLNIAQSMFKLDIVDDNKTQNP